MCFTSLRLRTASELSGTGNKLPKLVYVDLSICDARRDILPMFENIDVIGVY